MSVRWLAVVCALGVGCSDVPRAREADGGVVPVLTGRSQLAPQDASWVVRHRARAAIDASAALDAGRDTGLIPVQRIGHDGGPIAPVEPPAVVSDAGQPTAADEEDAGTEPSTPCDTSNCLCGRLCERGVALECAAEDPLDVCVELCDVASSDCYQQLLSVLRCKAELPDAAYSCDPDLLVFVVAGCVVEETALQTCRRF